MLTNRDCNSKPPEKDNQGNIISLSINIPNKDLYAEFIKHLESKKLLPSTNVHQEKKDTISESYKRPSPFSDIKKGPKPKGWKDTKDT